MKLWKKLTAAILCAACVCSLLAFPAGAASTVSTFSDVTDPQVGEAVEVLRIMGAIDGMGGGSYKPNGSLTRAQFCKMLIIVMGRGDEEGPYSTRTIFRDVASRHWARGYVNLAASTELDGGGSIYAASLGSVESSTFLLSCSTTADDGSAGAVQLLSGRYRVAAKQPASFFQGKRGTAVFSQNGLFLTFLPDKAASKTFLLSGATNTALIASDGAKYTVSLSTPVWYDGEKLTYGEMFPGLNRAGLSVTLFYTPAGAVDYIYVGGLSASGTGNVMIAKAPISGNPFADIIGGATGYTILKNGVPAALSDVRAYDVGVFDASSNTLYISDFRLTGCYQDALPNPYAPTSITFTGQEYQVLPSAADDLSALPLGSTTTLLFTSDGKVAGAVSNGAVQSSAIGVVSAADGNQVTVDLINAPSGVPSSLKGTSRGGSGYLGQLVSVSGGSNNTLYLTRLSDAVSGSLNVKARTVGSYALSDGVRVFERVGSGALAAISLGELTMDTVPAAKVSYAGLDYAGKVNLLVLDDVTGDRYTYGLAVTRSEITDYFGGQPVYNSVATITNRDGSVEVVGGVSFSGSSGSSFGGVVPAMDTFGDTTFHSVAGSVQLTAVKNATLSNFNLQTNRFFSGTLELPIADNVQCYNARTRTWFTSLRQCLAYSNDLTVYYDRAPELGGKIRLVVSN